MGTRTKKINQSLSKNSLELQSFKKHIDVFKDVESNTNYKDFKRMVEKAKKNYPNYTFYNGNVLKSITFPADSYSMISCFYFTIYYIKEKMELNFTLAPMINKGSITITAKAPTDDWDSLLTSYGNSSVRLKTGSSMTKRWLGFSSHIGYRYYFSRLLSVEGKLGYYMSVSYTHLTLPTILLV